MPNLPVIPEFITVHLGQPGANAQNVQVRFIDYIKNVASSEIYPTWPEASLRANILAQISFALNRVYTEWYRSRGYDFDITNTTQFDQKFINGRDIFENISVIVDDIFNDYVIRQGFVEPLFTQFCNGTTTTCAGLSQWGTVNLANNGLTAYEILQNYYGEDIDIVLDAPVQEVRETYPGVPLSLGSVSNEVRIIQVQLNRIRQNYPAIPRIDNPTGAFGQQTEDAVRKFQQVFGLTQDGIVGKATWYRIKSIFNGVKQLAELNSEGLSPSEVEDVFSVTLREGSQGLEVRNIQYLLNVIGYFVNEIPLVRMDGFFGTSTLQSVMAFQQAYGLTVDGVVGRSTWNKIYEVYRDLIGALPEGYSGEQARVYPGYFLVRGMRNDDVYYLQSYLNYLGSIINSIPRPEITGFFGDETFNSVIAFQSLYGLDPTGYVGPVTWNAIANEYDIQHGFPPISSSIE